jgi:hypothetical protein
VTLLVLSGMWPPQVAGMVQAAAMDKWLRKSEAQLGDVSTGCRSIREGLVEIEESLADV